MNIQYESCFACRSFIDGLAYEYEAKQDSSFLLIENVKYENLIYCLF
jgi:hypothetical protein